VTPGASHTVIPNPVGQVLSRAMAGRASTGRQGSYNEQDLREVLVSESLPECVVGIELADFGDGGAPYCYIMECK
jgi:hypothetical protein